MKKIIYAILMFSLVGVVNAAEVRNSIYVGAGANIQAVPDSYNNSGVGMSFKLGAHLDELMPNLGAEVEYTQSMSEPKNAASTKVKVKTLAAYMTYDICFKNSPVFVRPRIGFMQPNLDDKINSRDFGLSAGADVGVAITKSISAYVGYTNMGETLNDYTLGVEFYF